MVPSLPLQKRNSRGSDSHHLSSVVLNPANQSAVIRFFPNGKPRTRRAPRVEDFLIGSVARLQPQKQIDNQCVNSCVGHLT